MTSYGSGNGFSLAPIATLGSRTVPTGPARAIHTFMMIGLYRPHRPLSSSFVHYGDSNLYVVVWGRWLVCCDAEFVFLFGFSGLSL